jgi:hypothetical protein
MSTWISDHEGKWHPAKEIASLVNISDKPIEIEQTSSDGKKFKQTIQPGQPYIYEGPDRAAMFQWWEENGRPSSEKMKELEGNVTFGENFRTNNEFMEYYGKYRQMFGFKDVEEFLTYLGYDEKKSKKRFEENAVKVAIHDLPLRSPEIKKLGGGDDRANPGKNIRYGGFGEPAELSSIKA